MPAPEISCTPHANKPALGHVNLMVDSFIAHVEIDDLRSIVRGLLASGMPNVGSTFTAAARDRLRTTDHGVPAGLFQVDSGAQLVARPTDLFRKTLARTRCLYGAGLGFSALEALKEIVHATVGLRWDGDGEMARALTEIDADISQAIQSSKEEIEGGRVRDEEAARGVLGGLRKAIFESQRDVEGWGGEFPFERAAASVEFWKF